MLRIQSLKILPEWTLPPVIFKRAGRLSLYANYLHMTLFSSVLCARNGAEWKFPTNVGAQIDIRLVALSYLRFTLSTGYAVAFRKGHNDGQEWMMSLKIH